MSNLQIIQKTIKPPQIMNRLAMSLGVGTNKKGLEQARPYAASVLAEIEKTAGDPKRDLTGCNPQSIAQSMIDAASFKMKIDGRQHAHLIKFGNNCTLQIGYRGYLAKIKEHYPDADFVVEPVFEGDALDIKHRDGIQTYDLTKADVFESSPERLKGVLFVVRYTDNGRIVQKVSLVPRERIERAKKAAKQDFIWKSDYIEKAKAAAIKASCKIHFASLSGLNDVMSYDNTHNYDPEKERKETQVQQGNTIIDNLNDQILEGEIVEDEPPQEQPEPPPHDETFPGDLPPGTSMADLEQEHENQQG